MYQNSSLDSFSIHETEMIFGRLRKDACEADPKCRDPMSKFGCQFRDIFGEEVMMSIDPPWCHGVV